MSITPRMTFAVLLAVAVLGRTAPIAAQAADADRDDDAMVAALTEARTARLAAISQAAAAYNQAVRQADDEIARSYHAAIDHYRAARNGTRVRELQLELALILDHDFTAPQPTPTAGRHEELIQAIGPQIQNAQRRPFLTAETLASCEYLLIYRSASWCGSCREFTPKLVDFYNRCHDAHAGGPGSFEVVLVSEDYAAGDMFGYMRQDKMPWFTVPYARVEPSGLRNRFPGNTIPNLVVVNAQGEPILTSYQGTEYVGPDHVLDEFEKLIQ